MKNDARYISLKILNNLNKKKITLDILIDTFHEEHCSMPRCDKSLTIAIVYGVIRWQFRLDWIINFFSKFPLKNIKPSILNIIRIGLFQIYFLDKIPDSAAVNISVQMAKNIDNKKTAGFVNGILRTIIREYHKIHFPNKKQNIILHIAVTKSFPEWLIKRWMNLHGLKNTMLLCDIINEIPSITIRINTLKTTKDELIVSLKNYVTNISNSIYTSEGLSFYHPAKSVNEFEQFKKGFFQVQDEAAQLVSIMLHPLPGERVLDACAGLGGKTGHIAQLMNNEGGIIAIDNNSNKLKKLELEMKRLGYNIIQTLNYDLSNCLKNISIGKFDRILLDAPCSGLGVIRRNPDIKYSVKENDLIKYQKRQIKFLNNLKGSLKFDGKLVYAVCSTEPEETEEVIDMFLKENPNFYIDLNPKNELSFLNKNGYLQTYPHVDPMDSFFSVSLRCS